MTPHRHKYGIEATAAAIVDSCIHVHRELGAGLLESVYQASLAVELQARGNSVRCEVPVAVRYRGAVLDVGFRIDMVVDDRVLLENKSIQSVLPIHKAQLLTYLRLTGYRVGFLVNWNVPLIKDGMIRMVHDL